MLRHILVSLAVAVGLVAFALGPKNADAAIIYQTASSSVIGQSGGNAVWSNQFLGARFLLNDAVSVTSIGAHIGGFGTYFGALIRLSSADDLPDTANLTSPDVVGHTILNAVSPSTVSFAPLPVVLTPGFYGLVFGSGLFGATGDGYMPSSDPAIPPLSFFFSSGVNGTWVNPTLDGGLRGTRFIVEGEISQLSEPPGLTIVLATLLFGTLLLRVPASA
jgi:hypothetical protein